MLLLLLLLSLCGSLLTTPTTTHSHQPSRALTQRQPRACGLPFTHTLSHIATPSIGSWRTEFLHLLSPLSSCARSASVHACLLLALAACLCLIAAFTASHTRPHNSPHQPDTSHTHRPRANNANHHSSHSPLLTVLCDLSALRLSASRCLTAPHTHQRAPTSPHSDSLLAHSHTRTHTLKCVSRCRCSLSLLFCPGTQIDSSVVRTHTIRVWPAALRLSPARLSLSHLSLSMNRSRSWLSSVRNLALSRSARLAARNHTHTAQTGVRIVTRSRTMQRCDVHTATDNVARTDSSQPLTHTSTSTTTAAAAASLTAGPSHRHRLATTTTPSQATLRAHAHTRLSRCLTHSLTHTPRTATSSQQPAAPPTACLPASPPSTGTRHAGPPCPPSDTPPSRRLTHSHSSCCCCCRSPCDHTTSAAAAHRAASSCPRRPRCCKRRLSVRLRIHPRASHACCCCCPRLPSSFSLSVAAGGGDTALSLSLSLPLDPSIALTRTRAATAHRLIHTSLPPHHALTRLPACIPRRQTPPQRTTTAPLATRCSAQQPHQHHRCPSHALTPTASHRASAHLRTHSHTEPDDCRHRQQQDKQPADHDRVPSAPLSHTLSHSPPLSLERPAFITAPHSHSLAASSSQLFRRRRRRHLRPNSHLRLAALLALPMPAPPRCCCC